MKIWAPRLLRSKLYVEDMPLVVIIDSEGNNLYEEGRAAASAGSTKNPVMQESVCN